MNDCDGKMFEELLAGGFQDPRQLFPFVEMGSAEIDRFDRIVPARPCNAY
jgi:hypothetical protein